ncbi:glucokinase [Desulfovibrio sp. OttesenSCG-928-G15]|nr:glucokinase [Desulfovibrio sp. OttesenSCG-928-G15]
MASLLVADIGGTHSRFAVFEAQDAAKDGQALHLRSERVLRSRDFANAGEAVASLFATDTRSGCESAPLLTQDALPQNAVFAVAGAVQGDFCRLPNAPWNIDANEVRAALGNTKPLLINDFVAQAYACLMPELVDMVPLLPGSASRTCRAGLSGPSEQSSLEDESISYGVVGAGTGFGTAQLLCAPLCLPGHPPLRTALRPSPHTPQPAPPHWDAKANTEQRLAKAKVLPGEGGHMEFPFIGQEEFAFARFAADFAGTDRLIGDTVVTGSGLAAIVSYVTGRRVTPVEASVEAATNEECLALYAKLYARACRNFVLSTLCLNGLFIGGGMALRVPVLTRPEFAEEFLAGAHAELLAEVPVFHMQKPQAGLWGAAIYGLALAAREKFGK